MDIKKKLQNRTFVVTFITVLIAFIYQMFSMFGVVPQISEAEIMNNLILVINMLAMLGILVDPNTSGIKDHEEVID